MEEDKNELDMDLFTNEPVVDLTGGEELDYLFGEEPIDEDPIKDPVIDEDKEITNEDDIDKPIEPESVVGDNDTEDNTTEEDDSDLEGAEDTSSKPNLFNSLTALLSEKGLLSSVTSESQIETEDDFVDTFKKEIDTQVKQYLESKIGEQNAKYIEEGIPYEKIKEDQNYIDKINTINEESLKDDVDLRHRVIYQDYINKGFSEDRAKKNLQRSIELEQDVEDALESLDSIKTFNQSRIQKENELIIQENKEREKLEQNRINSIKKRITESDEIIKGYKITDSIKEKIEENMFKVVDTNPQTNQNENSLMKYRRENPEEFDHKLYYLFTITNGFQNLDSLVKNTKSRALKDLERAVQSNTVIKDPGSPAYLQDPDSYSIDISGHEVVVE